MACYHESMSSIGNTSMTSFLSTLMEDEQLSDIEIVVDNCRIDHDNSCTSLNLLEKDEPKCRWTNLVRTDSDLSSLSGRRSNSGDLSLSRHRKSRSRKDRLTINRPSMKGHRSVSESALDLKIPSRIESPTKSFPERSPKKVSRFNSDTQLLRMPQRRPSPNAPRKTLTRSGSRSCSMNASWNASEIKDSTEKTNLFVDIVVEAGDLASTGSLYKTSSASPCKTQSRTVTLAKQILAV